MAACQLSDDIPNRDRVQESGNVVNNFMRLPTVTVRNPKNLSIIDGGVSSTAESRRSSAGSCAASSPGSSPVDSCGVIHVVDPKQVYSNGGGDLSLGMENLETDVSHLKEKFEDVSSNNNNLHFSSPTMDKLRGNRRSLIRSNSSACSSISEDMEYGSDGNESEDVISTPRNRPPLKRGNAIHEDGDLFPKLSPRSMSPITSIEELETYSGIKTVVRRSRKSHNGRSSPSWRWSVMGVATGDYDAVTRATSKVPDHLHNCHPSTSSSSTPFASTPTGGHTALSRRGSHVGSPSALVSPRTKRLSTEFRRLSLQMDMPWRDPNDRLVKFADWMNKRTEELMERSARARQKTHELLRLAKQRQRDRIEF